MKANVYFKFKKMACKHETKFKKRKACGPRNTSLFYIIPSETKVTMLYFLLNVTQLWQGNILRNIVPFIK